MSKNESSFEDELSQLKEEIKIYTCVKMTREEIYERRLFSDAKI